MKILGVIALIVLSYGTSVTAQNKAAASSGTVRSIGPDAVWGPGMSIMQSIREECSSKSGTNFGECFAAGMRKSGASSSALAFTGLMENTGYMRDFREAGRVDIAYVNYPFRANENQGCVLVNGSPAIVDVDDWEILKKVDLKSNAGYAKIFSQYPDVSLFPGDRSGTGYPVVKSLPGGGQRFLVSYSLMKGCHACEVLGSVSIAFDFDLSGSLKNTHVVSAKRATN